MTDDIMGTQATLDDWMPTAFAHTAAAPALPTLGYRTNAVRSATGVTYRQLDYWARTGLVEPTILAADGSGNARLYSFGDIVTVRVVKRLLDTGVSLQNVRIATDCLRRRGSTDLAAVTLVCDGTSVYECTSDDDIVDLLAGGQGVFGIALRHTVTDVAAAVRHLPGIASGVNDDRDTRDGDTASAADELARRRAARRSA